jgi:serine/threonine protein kinase
MAGLAGIVLDHYKLVEEVGRGGMATVCRATDTLNNTQVAVKVLSPTISGDNRFVQRFKRESSLLAGLDHPNIVPVIDYGESKGMVYMVMPFVEGETLQSRMENNKVRRRRERERWILQIADALSFAHNHGIIHRDVKPSNVIIDDSGNAKLSDFGLAREVEGSNTLTGSMLLGTPAYMAPEQGRGDKVDARSDQYSLGVIIYQLITGRLPVPRPSRFVRNMSPALERVILKCMAKDPEYRYPSVGAFYQAYRAAREGASLSELELETIAVPIDSVLREELPAYQPDLEPVPKRRRSVRSILFLIGIPVVILGAFFAYPAINNFMEEIFSTGAFATAIPNNLPTEFVTNVPTNPPPTRTPQPTPIAINGPNFCVGGPNVEIYSPRVEGNNIIWAFYNDASDEVALDFSLDRFPENNASLLKISVGDQAIWEGIERDPGQVDLGDASVQELAPSRITEISLEFALAPANNGYMITLNFGAGCVIQAEW